MDGIEMNEKQGLLRASSSREDTVTSGGGNPNLLIYFLMIY